MKVLVAEDDPNILAGLQEVLSNEGFHVIAAADGEAALAAFHKESPDFVLLDIMMPKRSGYDVCREIRRKNLDVPVLFLSAKSEEVDKVVALELGADDFVAKPFGVRELTARIRAISRRCLQRTTSKIFRLGDLEVDPGKLRATRGTETMDLSLRETKLLALFAERRGEVLDRDTIFNVCWGVEHYPNSRTLDQAIAQLRKKVGAAAIQTVHGVGYRAD